MSRDRLIVALDVPAPSDALDLADQLGDAAGFYKMGMQLMSVWRFRWMTGRSGNIRFNGAAALDASAVLV